MIPLERSFSTVGGSSDAQCLLLCLTVPVYFWAVLSLSAMWLRYMANFGSLTPKPLMAVGTVDYMGLLQYLGSKMNKRFRAALRRLVMRRPVPLTTFQY